MRIWKKLAAFWTAVALLMGILPMGLSAAAAEEPIGTVSVEQLAFLTAMEFIVPDSNGELNLDRLLRRGEMADLICQAIGLTAARVDPGVPLYADITGNHTYAGAIKTVVEAGLMSLDKNGRFWPETIITLSDACEIFVNIQGGKALLSAMDPVTAASRVGILNGNIPPGQLTRGQVVAMLYDTLHASYYDQVLFGNKEVFQSSKEYLVLEALRGIIYGEGVVTGENGTNLIQADETLTEGVILIDGARFTGAPTSESYLGYAVKYYYQTQRSGGTPELCYISKASDLNRTLTISSELIEAASLQELIYREGEFDRNTKRAVLPSELDVIYNGVAFSNWMPEDMMPAAGSVTLVDNDGDNSYEVALVESYTFMVPGYVDSDEGKIYDQYDGAVLDLDEDDLFYTVRDTDGTPVSLSRVRTGRLLAVGASKNTIGQKRLVLVPGDLPVTGLITAIYDETIRVGEYFVSLSKALYNGPEKSELTMGENIAAYLWNDRAVRIERPNASRSNMAYLVNAVQDSNAFNTGLKFRIVQQSGVFTVLDGADRINIDGIRYRDSQKILDILAASAKLSRYNEAFPYAQPVQVWTTTDDRIYKIDTVNYNAELESEKDSLIEWDFGGGNARFFSANRSFYKDNSLLVTAPSTVSTIWVPTNARYDEEFYGFVSGGGFGNLNNYTVEPFFVQENMTAEFFVAYYTPLTTVSPKTQHYIVTDLMQALDADGEQVVQIGYMSFTGTTGTLTIPNTAICPELNVGDVVRYRTNYAGKITVVERIFNPYSVPGLDARVSDYEGDIAEYGVHQQGYAAIYGTVLYRENNIITITTSIASDVGGVAGKANVDNYLASGTTRFVKLVEEKGRPTVTTSSFSELIPYNMSPKEASQVFMFVLNDALSLVYMVDAEITGT